MYVADYKWSTENDREADKLMGIIEGLVEQADQLYELVEKEGDQISWN